MSEQTEIKPKPVEPEEKAAAEKETINEPELVQVEVSVSDTVSGNENQSEPEIDEKKPTETNTAEALIDDGEEVMTGDGEIQTKSESETKKKKDDDEEDDDDDEDDEDLADDRKQYADPNVMPQVNVALLAKRKWQIKIYPLKCGDFMSGQIGRAFKYAKESLMYILSPGQYSRGKGEMYASSAKNAARVVLNLMKIDFQCPEVNIEIIKKNADSEIEQKGFVRFDTKLVRMLCIPNVPIRRPGNKKLRSRGIGSVFVKNLPNATTKEMMRVLFPFAAEVNYNPEKFKDGTARLVLDNRSNVVPCLKAFAKVELGGNVLELHPLEKRRELLSTSISEKKTPVKKESESTSTVKAVPEVTKDVEKKKEVEGNKVQTSTAEKKEIKQEIKQEEPKFESPKKEIKKPPVRTDFRPRGRSNWFSRRRGAFGNEDKRSAGGPAVKSNLSKPETSPRGQLNKPDRRAPLGRDAPGNRSPHRQNRGSRGGFSNRNIGKKYSNWSSGGAGGRSRLGSGGSFGRSGRANRFDDPGFGGSMAGGSGEMGINVEATKEMMLLQNQLSMAIKNQIAMLSQTQMAVEQVKRSALTSDLAAGSSSGEVSRSYAGNKRRANQAGFKTDYSEDSYSSKRPNVSMQQSSWADDSSDYYPMQQQQQLQNLYYDSDRQGSDTGAGFGTGSSYNSRNLNSSSYSYDQPSYRYNY